MNISAAFSTSPHPMASMITIEIDSGRRPRIAKESVEESDLLKYVNNPLTPFVAAYMDGLEVSMSELKQILENL